MLVGSDIIELATLDELGGSAVTVAGGGDGLLGCPAVTVTTPGCVSASVFELDSGSDDEGGSMVAMPGEVSEEDGAVTVTVPGGDTGGSEGKAVTVTGGDGGRAELFEGTMLGEEKAEVSDGDGVTTTVEGGCIERLDGKTVTVDGPGESEENIAVDVFEELDEDGLAVGKRTLEDEFETQVVLIADVVESVKEVAGMVELVELDVMLVRQIPGVTTPYVHLQEISQRLPGAPLEDP